MKNEMKSTKEERRELAEQGVCEALLMLGLNGLALKRFFRHLYDLRVEQEEILFNKIEGGVEKYTPYSGSWERRVHEVTTGSVSLMVDGFNRVQEWAETSPTSSIIKAKHLNKGRKMLTVSLLYLTGTDESFRDPQHFAYFRRLISYWRKGLETIRFTHFLAGQPSYTVDIRHADLFLKVIEGVIGIKCPSA